MHLIVNGVPREVRDDCGLIDLVPDCRGVAVAVNGSVIRSADWPTTELCAGDLVEVVSAHQGG